jgi:hypothetical protein
LAGTAGVAAIAPAGRKFGMQDLWRMALWGMAAAAALLLVAYASTTETGRHRIALAAGELHALIRSSSAKPVRPLDAKEGQKLAESVRLLSTDRDRVAARITTLERSVDSITGSIARVEKAALAAQRPLPQALAAPADPASPAGAAPEGVTSSIDQGAIPLPPRTPAAAQMQTPPSGAVARAEFGLDIGSARTLEGLRALWTAALQRHAAQLDGLQPIIHLRERPRPAGLELRLVAGPIPNAAAAARLCARLSAAGALCQPAVFDGQRLAVR